MVFVQEFLGYLIVGFTLTHKVVSLRKIFFLLPLPFKIYPYHLGGGIYPPPPKQF